MKFIFSAIFLLLFLQGNVMACLSGHETKLLRRKFRPSRLESRDLKAEAPAIRKRAKVLLARYRRTQDPADYQNYAVQLIFLGRYDEALEVLTKLDTEGVMRGSYSTSSNIGTLYELLGDYECAYEKIKHALRVNPDAHSCSEWIHLNILDIKRQPGKAINSQNLIGIDFGTGPVPSAKVGKAKLDSLRDQIELQLTERMAFIRTKDNIVARLIFDLANVEVLLGRFDLAAMDYELARKYGMAGELLEARIANIPEAEKEAELAFVHDMEAGMAALSKSVSMRDGEAVIRADSAATRAKQVAAESLQAKEREEAFSEDVRGITLSALALLGLGTYLLVQRLHKRKA